MHDPGRIRKNNYHFYFQKKIIKMVMSTTINSKTRVHGDTFLPRLQKFKK
jgi:hypothetical protein